MEDRALALLRRDAAGTMPVHALHGALQNENGTAFATRGELGAVLRRRPDLFLLLEASDPLGPAPAWPPHLRAEYEAALRAAGVDMEPRVALAEAHSPWPAREPEPASPGSLERIDASLIALWARATGDPRLRAVIAVALRESEEIRQRVAASASGMEMDIHSGAAE
jgi:hypothetical protein